MARAQGEIGDGYVLGPVRSALGVVLAWQALIAAEEFVKVGYFGDVFHLPFLPEALVPSRSLYTLIVAVRVCLAVMVMIGAWARPALAVSALLGLWVLLSDRLQFHDNRYSVTSARFFSRSRRARDRGARPSRTLLLRGPGRFGR